MVDWEHLGDIVLEGRSGAVRASIEIVGPHTAEGHNAAVALRRLADMMELGAREAGCEVEKHRPPPDHVEETTNGHHLSFPTHWAAGIAPGLEARGYAYREIVIEPGRVLMKCWKEHPGT